MADAMSPSVQGCSICYYHGRDHTIIAGEISRCEQTCYWNPCFCTGTVLIEPIQGPDSNPSPFDYPRGRGPSHPYDRNQRLR